MTKEFGIGERTAWNDFPDVIRNGDLGMLKQQPEYLAAKSGDMPAALEVVTRLLTDETVDKIRNLIGDSHPRLLPVMAVETAGNNKIPLAMAEVLADRLGLEVEVGIIQKDKVSRTDAGADYRLAFNPTFRGDVKRGETYLIVDDTLTMGGTIASLRGYVENRGGRVIAASVMTAHKGVLNLSVKPSMLAGIENKHGPGINQFWQETFGYGIDKLTQGEAGHIKSAQTIDGIRDRIVAARHEGLQRLGAGRAETQTRSKSKNAGSLTAGERLVSSAERFDAEQLAMIDSASVEQTYQESLAVYVQAKHEQVERIEERLENLIDRQQVRLQQIQSNRPGFLSAPGTRRAWQNSQLQHQARLQTLHVRLETVREIRDGMGVYAPRIEELATRKMRAENPQLARQWDVARREARQLQAVQRQAPEHENNSKKRRAGLSLTRQSE